MTTKQIRRQLERDNKRYPDHLVMEPPEDWRHICVDPMPVEAWRSRRFMVQVYAERAGRLRMSVMRSELMPGLPQRWKEGITWEELQTLKREIGRGEWYAVEVYPLDSEVVNVANMRHLWLLPEPLDIGWFR